MSMVACTNPCLWSRTRGTPSPSPLGKPCQSITRVSYASARASAPRMKSTVSRMSSLRLIRHWAIVVVEAFSVQPIV